MAKKSKESSFRLQKAFAGLIRGTDALSAFKCIKDIGRQGRIEICWYF